MERSDARKRREELEEEGRRLASMRDDLIAAGVDPAELPIPLSLGGFIESVVPDTDHEVCDRQRHTAEVKAWRDAADKVDTGPTFPLLPGIISRVLREHADMLEVHYALRVSDAVPEREEQR